jgi:ribosomal protein L28
MNAKWWQKLTLQVGKQEVRIWWVQKRFTRYGVPIWSLWPNIRSLPSIVAEKNGTKNVHICSMCIKNQLSRQTGSRNLTGPKTFPTIWHTYMKLVTKYQISVINSCLEKCDEKCAYTNICSMCIKINKIGKQEVGIWWVQKRFPWYEVPIWSLWPNIRFLPSIVAEKNVTKNVHICSMCIKTN